MKEIFKIKTLHKDRFEVHSLLPATIDEIRGYTACLQDLLEYLTETTGFKPENRYIDALPLIDMIAATNGELVKILTEERAKLNEITKNIL